MTPPNEEYPRPSTRELNLQEQVIDLSRQLITLMVKLGYIKVAFSIDGGKATRTITKVETIVHDIGEIPFIPR